MILTVGNIKGGVGKTTLAVNITIARALAGKDVLLVDGDEQRTALTFTDLRTQQHSISNYTAVSLQGAAVRTQVRQLASKYDDIVIDVGGRDTGSFRAALTISDILLIPVQPRSFDIWAVDQVAELVTETLEVNETLRTYAVLNCADPQGRDNKEAADALKDIQNISLLPAMIGRRKAFPNAAAQGQSVLEQSPKDEKAIKELRKLLRLLYSTQA